MTSEIKSVISKFSRELETIEKNPKKYKRYPVKFKKALAGLVEVGAKKQAISNSTGIHITTITNWHNDYYKQASNGTGFKEISVIEDEPLHGDYIIETPSGYKIHLHRLTEITTIMKEIEIS